VAIAIVNFLLFGGFSATFTTGTGVTFSSGALFGCALVGLAVTALIVVVTEYYTGVGYRPGRSIAQASVTGHGHERHPGASPCRWSRRRCRTISIVAGIIVAYARRPVRHRDRARPPCWPRRHDRGARRLRPGDDTAGGIAEMAGLSQGSAPLDRRPRRGRQHHKAVTKGYAIGSAGLGPSVLFAAYTSDLNYFIAEANRAGSTTTSTSAG
jgi:K(+)-stimulated pyrophosphate-energized sodium pump